MKKLLLSIFFIAAIYTVVFAQSNPAQKKMEKINSLLEKDKIEKAEEELVDLLDDYPSYGKAWDLLSKIRLYHYNQSKSMSGILGGNITITTTDEDGNEVKSEDDSLATSLMNLLNNMDPSKMAYDKWLFTMRKATLSSNSAYGCSISLRNELRAIEVDSNINTKALKYYNKAEAEFTDRNFNKAAELYQRALEHEPNFYKARLYLADAFYFMGNYTEAIKYFKICAEKYPRFLEPRKYLIDAYTKEGLIDNALEEAIEATLVYPDLSNNVKMEDLLYETGKKLEVEWQARPIFPNKIESDTTINLMNKYSDPNPTEPNDQWVYYSKALPKIKEYCDEKGLIIKSNSLTQEKYLEVYSWEEMLKNSDNKKLDQARKMQSLGFLDCYALITCFHDDNYEQFLHFVTNNKEKIENYFDTIIVSR